MYKWLDQYWLTSEDEEWFVESPVPNDIWRRVYIAGGEYPKYTAFNVALTGFDSSGSLFSEPRIPTTTYRLGVPAPQGTPGVLNNEAPDPTAPISTTSYVYTFVTQYGEEGPPSFPTPLVSFVEGQTRTVSFPNKPNGNYAFGDGSLIRVYRTATGSSASEFLFVKELPLATDEFIDDSETDDLGEALPSESWFRPLDDDLTYAPDGPLKKIVMMSGGFLAGFAGRVVAFSEQYLPHAWDPSNALLTESNIVTIQEASTLCRRRHCALSNGTG